MRVIDPIEAVGILVKPASENITASWTAISAAIDSAQSLLSKMGQVSAAEYERFGRQIMDMAVEYSRGLTKLSEGAGTAAERQALSDIASSLQDSIENLRNGGAEAYASYGKAVLQATEGARIAKLAAIGGAAVDFAELTAAIADGRSSGDWTKVGGVSAGIGAAAILGEVGAILTAMSAAMVGASGAPVVVLTFVVAGVFAFLGSAFGQDVFDFIDEQVNSLFIQSRDARPTDPLAIDLDGDGIETIPVNATTRVLFDHDGDGTRTGTGWLKGDDGWLVLDRNGNGQIDNGGELFGVDTTLPNARKATDGFSALASLDSNQDSVFDAADAEFARVQIWCDLDQDGVSDPGELQSLSAAGIARISLASVPGRMQLNGGNIQTASAIFTRTDGSTGKVANIDLEPIPIGRDARRSDHTQSAASPSTCQRAFPSGSASVDND